MRKQAAVFLLLFLEASLRRRTWVPVSAPRARHEAQLRRALVAEARVRAVVAVHRISHVRSRGLRAPVLCLPVWQGHVELERRPAALRRAGDALRRSAPIFLFLVVIFLER